jgi:hypothetical protein
MAMPIVPTQVTKESFAVHVRCADALIHVMTVRSVSVADSHFCHSSTV